MVEAKAFTKSFGAMKALDDLNLKVGKREIICRLGANGAGKTTAINLFQGFLEPTSGAAIVDGLNVAEAPNALDGFFCEKLTKYATPAIFLSVLNIMCPVAARLRFSGPLEKLL